jgi:hypothetical protein
MDAWNFLFPKPISKNIDFQCQKKLKLEFLVKFYLKLKNIQQQPEITWSTCYNIHTNIFKLPYNIFFIFWILEISPSVNNSFLNFQQEGSYIF